MTGRHTLYYNLPLNVGNTSRWSTPGSQRTISFFPIRGWSAVSIGKAEASLAGRTVCHLGVPLLSL